jgi:hypothetical protein
MRTDAVAMHGLEHLARGQEHGRRTIVRQHEPVPVAMPTHGTDDQLRHAFAQHVFAAPVANDLAGVQQLFDLRLQSPPCGLAVATDTRRQLVERERSPRFTQCIHHAGLGGRRLRGRGMRARSMCFLGFLR